MKTTQFIGPIELFEAESLGSGSTGNVYRGKIRPLNYHTGQIEQIELAVKVIPHYQRYQNQVTQYLFQSQKQALTTLNHPYVIKCFGVYQDGRNSYLATGYMEGGTLKQYLSPQKKNSMSQKQAISLVKRLLQGLSYVSNQGFVHRDLKPANIMIKQMVDKSTGQKTITPVIIDFGFAERFNSIWKPQMFYNVGSPSYMAPQSYNFTRYSQKSDLWSIGVIFYEILTGQSIDKDFKIDQFFSFPAEAIQKKLNEKKIYFSIRSLKILRFMLVFNQDIRPNLLQALNFIQRIQSQHEAYTSINKRAKVVTNVKTQSAHEPKHTQTHQVDEKASFFQLKSAKPRQRSRVPSFLEKNKKGQTSSTIQRAQHQASPKYNFYFGHKRQLQAIKLVKSRENIKTAYQQKIKNNLNAWIYVTDNQNQQKQKSLLKRRKTQTTTSPDTTGAAENLNSARQRYPVSQISNPKIKTFNKYQFKYRPESSNSFQKYFSPSPLNSNHQTKQPKFYVSTRT